MALTHERGIRGMLIKRHCMAKVIKVFWGLFLVSSLLAVEVGAQTVLNMGYSGFGINSDLRRVMERERLWQKHGLDVRGVYFNSGSLLAQAMLGDHVSVSDGDVPAMLNVAVSGILDLKVIAVTINRLDHIFVVRQTIKKPEDLKGKRAAISRFGSASDITTRLALRFWKLNPDKDITMLQSGNTPTRMAALIAGQVDAALVTPGYLDKVLASGCCRVLADLSELPMDYARFGIVVPTSLLRNQRETLRRFIEALIEGIYVFKTRPDVAQAVLSEQTKEPELVKSLYQRYARIQRDYPVPDLNGVQAVLDSLLNPMARGARAEDFIDASLIAQIKKSGAINRLYGR